MPKYKYRVPEQMGDRVYEFDAACSDKGSLASYAAEDFFRNCDNWGEPWEEDEVILFEILDAKETVIAKFTVGWTLVPFFRPIKEFLLCDTK